jgi:hypothetical protein
MNLPGASHVVVYSMQDPAMAVFRRMVAIAVNNTGQRLNGTAQQQYAPAIHNCPPDCDISAFVNKLNLLKHGSTQ